MFDPFCGCGTTIAAAHKLNRRWLGIDVTHLSIALQKYRLHNQFELVSGSDYDVIGEPTTVDAARALANDPDNEGRYQFEWWALSLIGAKPTKGKPGSRKGQKGADRGIDGIINFFEEDDRGKPIASTVVVQVKSGKVTSRDIRDLKGTVEREKAVIGVFITLEKPTAAMQKEALAASYYESPGRQGKRYRKMQILTIADLLDSEGVECPGSMRLGERNSINRAMSTPRESLSRVCFGAIPSRPTLRDSRIRLFDIVGIASQVAIDVGIADHRHIGDYIIAADSEVEDFDAAHTGKPMTPQRDFLVQLPTSGDRRQQIITPGKALRGVTPVLRGDILIQNVKILLFPIHLADRLPSRSAVA